MSTLVLTEPPAWSVDSYLIRSTLFSRRHSVLVEGRSDKDVTARVLGVYYGDDWQTKFQIDTAEIIRSPDEGKLGNREKVEAVFKQLAEPSDLTGLVDREYRALDKHTPEIESNFAKLGLYWTRGHSIENSFLNRETIKSIIRDRFPALAGDVLFDLLDYHHNAIAVECAAVCLASFELGLTTVLAGAGQRDPSSLWRVSPGGLVHISGETLKVALMSRQLDEGRIRILLERYESQRSEVAALEESAIEDFCHGHVGVQLYWTGVAFLARQLAECEERTARQLAEFGARDEFRLSGISAVVRDHETALRRIPYLLRACRVPDSH